MNRKRRNEKGFTMVELVIVVAIMGIIGAVLVPSFNNMAAKAKLSTDISTTKTVKRLIDIYNAEKATPLTNGSDTTGIATALNTAGYLEGTTIELKTGGTLTYTAADGDDPSTLKLDLTGNDVDDSILSAAGKMDVSTTQNWLILNED